MYNVYSSGIPKSVSYRVYTEHLVLIFNKFKTHFVLGISKTLKRYFSLFI